MRFACVLALAMLASPMARAADTATWQERPVSPDAPALPAQPVWLRAYLRVPDAMAGAADAVDLWRDSMTMTLPAGLAGPVVVSINGKTILEASDIPADAPRRFKVPKGSFEKGAYNAIVIKLDGAKAPRGLTRAPFINGYFDEVRFDRAWQTTTTEPAAADVKPVAGPPAIAAYTEKDFHPATTVMGASKDPVRGLYVSPADALAKLKPADDLVVEELLHEPQVAQPTHVSFDERGRMWVAQYRQYPYPAGVKMISRDKYYRSKYDRVPPAPPNHTPGADIISVHEDKDGDGVYETHRNVLTGLNMANAALRGHGGIWVMHTPYLLFYPDSDGDDTPNGPPEVRLAGFGLEDTHSVANGLAWGPDGWLYGAQGSTTTSRVTRPGVDPATAPGVYVEGCMVWRYHPKTKAYEIFADGSGNTFGVSFDGEGRLYTGHNGGETRGWHHVQEGLYLKQGKDPGKFGPANNPYAFGEMPMMRSTNPIARFTHMTIFAEGTALPDRWRNRFIGVDPLHHNVVAADRKRTGSTFETTDVGVPLRADDRTFRPVYVANSPDGSLTIADFREEFIAHGQNYQSQIDQSTGRIYRLRGKGTPVNKDVDLSKRSTAQLVALLSHANPWHRQTAVRLLAERNDPAATALLFPLIQQPDTHPALEALWVLHQTSQLDEELGFRALAHPAAAVRAWAVRLPGDSRVLHPARFDAIRRLAANESDAEVRCQILSTARRLPAAQALPLARATALRTEDVNDPFIPLMTWFVIESHCAPAERDQVLALFDRDSALWDAPLSRKHIVPRLMRRFAAAGTRQDFAACAGLLARAPSDADRAALMAGFEEAFKGRAVPPLPDELMRALAATGRMTLLLRVRNNEPAALAEALAQASNAKAKPADRLAAVRVFGEVKHEAAIPALLTIATAAGPADLRAAACTALQLYDDPAIGESLAKAWPSLPAGVVRDAALNLLASRPAWAARLLESFSTGKIPRAAFSADVLSRLRQHKDDKLAALLDKHFPAKPPAARESLRPRVEEVRKVIAAKPGDPYKGEPIFIERCSGCHTLFYKGGKTGPDLTPYQRDDLGTMLTSVVDPNAEIREGYENYLVKTTDGRSLSGFLADQDKNVVVLRGFDGADVSLKRSDIAKLDPAGQSLMPEGLLDELSDAEIRDLFAYLRQSQPITR